MKLLFLDIDGTLTDGKIYFGNEGEVMKAFNVQDGYGIKCILPNIDCLPIIITGRESKIVKMRCKDLSINEIYQGCDEKLEVMEKVCEKYGIFKNEQGIFPQTYYIGDDIPDAECMKNVEFSAAPANAVSFIKDLVKFKCRKNGGEGAVREFIDWIATK